MTKIIELREKTSPLNSNIRNAVIDFSGMSVSTVAVITDAVRDGKKVIGYGFHSNGRYAQSSILRERLFPRVLAANADDYQDHGECGIDPIKLAKIAMQNEKPGGHGDRAVAAAALDMAMWDAAAKIAGQPLWKLVAERFNNGEADARVMVYPGGGYYSPNKNLEKLRDEMRSYFADGHAMVKMKIGGASLAEDLKRIDAVVATAGGEASRVAVDANGRLSLREALQYADALHGYNLFWFEEPLEPLDFAAHMVLGEHYLPPLATGENLFSAVDARNLIRHGGLRVDRDWIQIDPGLAGGLSEYLNIITLCKNAGWSPRRFVPHGGHQFALNIVAGLQLGACESYSGVFQPYGGFADDIAVQEGFVTLPQTPGIGMEHRPKMLTEMQRLLELA